MKNPVTTITGIILSVVGIAGFVGLITQEQSVELTKAIPVIVELIAGIVLAFKAGDKGGV